MTRSQLKIVLWIGFTVLWFVVFCGMQYLISGAIDWGMAIFFFIVLGLLGNKGVNYIVEYCLSKNKK